jgi:PAS domain S-box-containing protein
MLNERTRQLAEGDFASWVSFDTLNTSITEVAELAGRFQHMQQAVLQRQAALQVSEARFREMAELLPDMIIELDAARRMRYANRAAQDLLGDFEPGKLFDRMLARDEADNLIDICRLAANGASLHPQVLRFVRPNGVTFPGELVLTALRGRDSSLLGYRGVVRDITDRLAFEETLRRSYQLFTEGPVVVFRVRASGDHPVEYVSPNISQYGYRPHDFISRRDFFKQIIFPTTASACRERSRAIWRAGALLRTGIPPCLRQRGRALGVRFHQRKPMQPANRLTSIGISWTSPSARRPRSGLGCSCSAWPGCNWWMPRLPPMPTCRSRCRF